MRCACESFRPTKKSSPKNRITLFNLSWLDAEFLLEFEQPVAFIRGENGSGKATLIETIAALAEYGEARDDKGYMLVCPDGASGRAVAAEHWLRHRTVALSERSHFRLYRSFANDPVGFVTEALEEII